MSGSSERWCSEKHMRGLSFLADGELYMVDVTLVQKVVGNMAATPVPAAPDAVVGIANLKGRIVTVLSLAALLGRARSGGARATEAVSAVVLKPFADGGDQMGLLIDKPGDLITVSESKILPPPATAEAKEKRCVSGVTEWEGKLYRIIDVDSIISRFRGKNPVNVLEGTNQ